MKKDEALPCAAAPPCRSAELLEEPDDAQAHGRVRHVGVSSAEDHVLRARSRPVDGAYELAVVQRRRIRDVDEGEAAVGVTRVGVVARGGDPPGRAGTGARNRVAGPVYGLVGAAGRVDVDGPDSRAACELVAHKGVVARERQMLQHHAKGDSGHERRQDGIARVDDLEVVGLEVGAFAGVDVTAPDRDVLDPALAVGVEETDADGLVGSAMS